MSKRELAAMKLLVDAMDKKIGVQSYKELADKSGYELIRELLMWSFQKTVEGVALNDTLAIY